MLITERYLKETNQIPTFAALSPSQVFSPFLIFLCCLLSSEENIKGGRKGEMGDSEQILNPPPLTSSSSWMSRT